VNLIGSLQDGGRGWMNCDVAGFVLVLTKGLGSELLTRATGTLDRLL
jgi:hypothetical protein